MTSMLPREHGAYGQLAFPLLTALAVGRPGIAAVLLVAAGGCAFMAHEPLVVLLGQRGVRAQRERRARAMRWFAGFAGLATVFGAIAIARLPSVARLALIVPAVLGGALAVVILWRSEHTTAGEVLSALTLSSLAVPVALASAVPLQAAVTCAGVFGAGFVAATVAVRAVIVNTRQRPAVAARVAGALVSGAAVGGLVWARSAGFVTMVAPWAVTPLCAGAAVLVVVPPPARRLRIVGWTLVATTAATTAVLVGGLRG